MKQPNHPWNPLPVAPKGDELDTTLYEAVGRALSAWELMEGILGRIFSLLCSAELEGAERAYGVVSSFTGRKELLAEAFACFPRRSVDGLAQFPALLERIKQFSARRNEIAHGLVIPIADATGSLGFYSLPAMYNSRKRAARSEFNALEPASDRPWHIALKYAYNSEQVNYYRTQFIDLATQALRVADALGALAQEAYEEKLRHGAGGGGGSVEGAL